MKKVGIGILGLLSALSATAVTVTTFTGGDAGEGLDFHGNYLYAVNVGGNPTYPPIIQGVVFTNDTLLDGVTVTLGGTGNLKAGWGTGPVYGTSQNDIWLGANALMHATALSYGTDPLIEVDLNVTAGVEYELQLLFSENTIKTADGRKFDVAVEGVKILDEFTSIPVGAEWSTAPHTGVSVVYQFVAEDDIVSIDLTSGSSGDVNPIIQAVLLKEVVPEAVVTSFTGGDLGEGIELSGEYIYAVNVAGDALTIQGIPFTADDSTVGFAASSSSGYKGFWGTGPSYGTSPDDIAVATMLHTTTLAWDNGQVVEVDMDVTAGLGYELQLFFSENVISNGTFWGRHFDITVEGDTVVDEFTPCPAEAAWSVAPHTGYLVTYRFIARDSVINVDLTNGSSGDPNPLLQGVTLKEIVPVINNYTEWAELFLPTEIGIETDDYDGDTKDNYYEYVFKGDPTNALVTGEAPVMVSVDGDLLLTHLQRALDTNLVYSLEACDGLISGRWTNLNYVVLGTNVTGGMFNEVTNDIPAQDPDLFVRLKVDTL